jgi:hypothetical protein
VSIAHELSSEVAVAILSRREEKHKLEELREVVLRVHSVLQKLTAQCRQNDRERRLATREFV